MKICSKCGNLAPTTPCADCGQDWHRPTKKTAQEAGYTAAWAKLSRKARALQPFCTDCGAVDDLQLDHLPGAWEHIATGKKLRLQDGLTEVVCGPCNRRRGRRRPQTRGVEVPPNEEKRLAPSREDEWIPLVSSSEGGAG